VVAAERVDDLLRGTTEAARTRLGLQAGLEIAKRAGAGQMVMGEYLKQGARTTITAHVYNVRTGQRTRSVSEPAQTTDSVAAAYERLAPKVVNVPLPPGTTLTGLGTTSAQAIRSYALGLQAQARGRADSAANYLLDAIRFDSTFALGHYALVRSTAMMKYNVGERYPGGEARARATAARLSSGLPIREQLVMAPGLTDCVRATRLLALDSADAEAWFALGGCNGSAENARLMVGPGGAVTRKVSYQAVLTALERGLALQADVLTIARIQNNFRNPLTWGCTVVPPCAPENRYWAARVVDGDTIAARYEPINRFDAPVRRREFAAGRLAMFSVLSAFVAQWTVTHPDDINAHAAYGDYLAQLGDLDGALREYNSASEFGQLPTRTSDRGVYFYRRAEADWKLLRPARANVALDSMGAQVQEALTAFGRFSRGVGTTVRQDADFGPDTDMRPLATAFNGVYAGVVRPDFAETMRAYAATAPARTRDIIEVGTTLAFHALRSRPATDTAAEFSLFRLQAFLAAGNVAAARRALGEYDAWGSARADYYWDAYEMFAAESHLELGDTATAWTRIEPFARRWPRYEITYASFWAQSSIAAAGPVLSVHVGLGPSPSDPYLGSLQVLGRAWLLYADLAMATGHTDEARRGYTMIVGMWEKGEAPVQPLVARARAALASLGK
jgi:tetratricopeptide (TPR) repeat protein